jgi:transposase
LWMRPRPPRSTHHDAASCGREGAPGLRLHRHAQGHQWPRDAGPGRAAADPFSGHLFVFRGRKANLIKIVYWDGTGLCLFTKRLEHGVFLWPSNVDRAGTLMLTSAQLSTLIDRAGQHRTGSMLGPRTTQVLRSARSDRLTDRRRGLAANRRTLCDREIDPGAALQRRVGMFVTSARPLSTCRLPRRGHSLCARAGQPSPDSSKTAASNSTTIRSSAPSGPSRSGARTIYSRARTVAASDEQPSAPLSPPQSSTTSSPLPGSETSCSA